MYALLSNKILLNQQGKFRATEDNTDKDDPNIRVEKVETYAEKVSAGVKTVEVSGAGVSSSKTSASTTTRATFPRLLKLYFRTRLI